MRYIPLTLLVGFTQAEADYLNHTHLITDSVIRDTPMVPVEAMKDRIFKVVINPDTRNVQNTITELFVRLPHTLAIRMFVMDRTAQLRETVDIEMVRRGHYLLNEGLLSDLTRGLSVQEWIARKIG